MDNEKMPQLQDILKKLIWRAMYDAITSHTLVFKDVPNVDAGVAFANKAYAQICAAEAFYYSNIDILEHSDIENVFYQFGVYCDELLTCYSTDHSHQWTNIEFDSLKETFDNSVVAFENH